MTNALQSIIYLNGDFLPAKDACVSVFDRGFLLGDGVYEVVPFFDGKLFCAKQHLQRLQKSLHGSQLNYPFDENNLLELIDALLKKNPNQGSQRMVYLQITRGAGSERSLPFPENVTPTVFAYCAPFKPLSLEELNLGASAITVDDIRWQWCYIKAITLLPSVLFMQQAKDKNAKEAILIRNGEAMECTTSNLFIVKDGVIKTPPLSPNILAGITRGLVIDLAKHHQLACHETRITEQELRQADEIWVTGSVKEILPITKLDDKPVGTGQVGNVWRNVVKLYNEYKQHI
jgi:D-alanine transaminase